MDASLGVAGAEVQIRRHCCCIRRKNESIFATALRARSSIGPDASWPSPARRAVGFRNGHGGGWRLGESWSTRRRRAVARATASDEGGGDRKGLESSRSGRAARSGARCPWRVSSGRIGGALNLLYLDAAQLDVVAVAHPSHELVHPEKRGHGGRTPLWSAWRGCRSSVFSSCSDLQEALFVGSGRSCCVVLAMAASKTAIRQLSFVRAGRGICRAQAIVLMTTVLVGVHRVSLLCC